MIWGLQWDATCKWLATSKFDIKDSSKWGNYSNNTADGHGSKQDTGFSESWKANNIYDFAGNCFEFTQEAYSIYLRASRGGIYLCDGSSIPASTRGAFRASYPASGRYADNPVNADSDVGSRPTLYLIP